MAEPEIDGDAAKAARHYAWEWFKLHATQRMTVFNLFLLITGATITGFITAITQGHYEVGFGLSVLEIIVVAAFFRLDKRNSRLVKIAEEYLKFDEEQLARSIGSPLICLADAAEQKPRSGFHSFRQVLRAVFLMVGILACSGLVLSLSLCAIQTDQQPAAGPTESCQDCGGG